MRLLVIHGSADNLGDTAMLEGVVRNLRRNLPDAELFVAHYTGLRTSIWEMPGVHLQVMPEMMFPGQDSLKKVPLLWRLDGKWRRAVGKWAPLGVGGPILSKSIDVSGPASALGKPSTLRELCAPFDALWMVGGGYLTDIFPEQLAYFCSLAQAFAEQNKPILLSGQQVGPFKSRWARTLVRKLLRRAQFVGLREPTASFEFCKEFGLAPERFQTMGDDSFGLPDDGDTAITAVLAEQGLEPGKFLAFNVRTASYSSVHGESLRSIAQIADGLTDECGMPVLIVPIAFNADDNDVRSGNELRTLIRSPQARMLPDRQLTPSFARAVLGRAFGAIGVSYHFCTFALSESVPAVCLHEGGYYSQKGRGICGFWQDERLALPLKNVDVPSAVCHIASVLRDADLRSALRSRATFAIDRWHKIFDQQVQAAFGNIQPVAPALEVSMLGTESPGGMSR